MRFCIFPENSFIYLLESCDLMTLKTGIFQFLICLVVSLATVYLYTEFIRKERIGYVRTGEVIQSFNEFKRIQRQFESELRVVRGNADTLRTRYEALKNDPQRKNKSTQDWAYQVGKAENEWLQYQKNAEAQMQARQQELSRDAIDKINLYIQDYGKQKGFKLILGATDGGNILYGESGDDITKEILEGLNKKYPRIH